MTIPITILTGFLGSGKTTLLNHALRGSMLARALVVVNELGEVPLDHLFVKEVREDVLLLASGCVCCSIRGDLVETLGAEALAGRFDRVFVETTGIADPVPIVSTLVRHPDLSSSYHLDAVVTAVDGEHAPKTLARHEEARRQVMLADDLVLTKVDRVGADALEEARTVASALAPGARVFVARHGQLDWRPILEWAPSTVAARLDVPTLDGGHGPGEVRTFSARRDHAVDFRTISLWLSMVTQFHGESVLRVKGLLRIEEEPGPVVVHAVQHVVLPTYTMPRWPSADRSSRLMVITRGMSSSLVDELRASLETALAARRPSV